MMKRWEDKHQKLYTAAHVHASCKKNEVYVLVFDRHGLCTTSSIPGDATESGVRLSHYSSKYVT